MTIFVRHAAIIVTILISYLGFWSASRANDCETPLALCVKASENAFPLIIEGQPVPLLISPEDAKPVQRVAEDVIADLSRVGGQPMSLVTQTDGASHLLIAGTLGQSAFIDPLVASGKVDVSEIEGEWEAYLQTVVETPLEGVESALVVIGSDPRGTVYGLYDMVERSGVSPWEWWADVPVRQQANLYVTPGMVTDAPAVQYRGIFLNDENPALYGWVHETFDGFNADFYERVFQLILRQKGNYLWPAMWGKAFYDDDPLNKVAAEEYGIVIGTSHHEPLLRAHVEWQRYGEGPWDYTLNAEELRTFWRDGMERMGNEDTIVTVGMRGDGDEAMTEGTAIELLETIVRDQRNIIEDVTGKPASKQPQLWALYKEVQDYYDQGMEVPDDITLLFADDNWGNIRRLPKLGAERPGGYGVYYHFDYVGGPRNYKWINVTQNERTWEQMRMAWEYGAHKIWIVNVGDLKPMEFPISFFLDYAWNPEDMTAEAVTGYSEQWAAQQFGTEHAAAIAGLLDLYTKYNARRNPELLDADTYSLINHDEFARVVAEYNALAQKADQVRYSLPEKYDDAFLQLVWFPIHASANLNELYYTVALNRLYADQARVLTNDMAERAQALYARDAELTRIYHQDIAGGKWNHMMSQTHIGYTYWQQPEEQVMPEVTEIDLPRKGTLGVSISGDTRSWPGTDSPAILPIMDSIHRQTRTVELFNKGRRAVRYTAEVDVPWLQLSSTDGKIRNQMEIEVTVNWAEAPDGRSEGHVTIKDKAGKFVARISVPVLNASATTFAGAIPDNNVISMDASSPHCMAAEAPFDWEVIPNLGRTGSAILPIPVTAKPQIAGDGPHLTYQFSVFEPGIYEAEIFLSPSLDVTGTDGLDFAVSLNDGAPQSINIEMAPDQPEWNTSVADRAHRRTVTFEIKEVGPHSLTLWMVDPGTVFQKIVISKGEAPQSYLGAPATKQLPSTLDCAVH